MQNKRKELEDALRDLQGNKDIHEMQLKELSGYMWNHYNNYINSGFSKEQAFELIVKRGVL